MSTSRPTHPRGSRRLTTAVAAAASVGLVAATGAFASTPGAGGIGDPYYPAYGNGGYDAIHYDLFVDYNPTSGYLSGTAVIKLKATQDLSSFNLDLVLKAKTVTVNGKPADFAKPSLHELVVKPTGGLKNGSTNIVKVTYGGTPSKISDNGISPWVGTGSEVVALGEPEIAAWWFPSNDHPRDKATYNLTYTVPKGLEAIGPGDLVGKTSGATKDVWKWSVPQPAATYLIFMAIGQYDVLTGTANNRKYTTAITTARSGSDITRARTDLLRTPEVVNWAAKYFGPYPFKSVGGVIASSDFGFALETQNRPTYTPGFWSGGSNMSVVVHENAHQWFGDSVSVNNWKDIWLNEGFASYAEFLWSETHGEGTVQELLAENYNMIPASDKYFWGVPIINPGVDNVFSNAVYLRGAMTLAALRNRIGDDNLTKVFKTWTANKKYGNASVPEFMALAERISGQDLDGFFRNWLRMKVKPAATAENGLADIAKTTTKPKSGEQIRRNAELLLDLKR